MFCFILFKKNSIKGRTRAYYTVFGTLVRLQPNEYCVFVCERKKEREGCREGVSEGEDVCVRERGGRERGW